MDLGETLEMFGEISEWHGCSDQEWKILELKKKELKDHNIMKKILDK